MNLTKGIIKCPAPTPPPPQKKKKPPQFPERGNKVFKKNEQKPHLLFLGGELQVELLPVHDDVEEEVEQVGQRQREQTHVDALLQPLPVEHRHVDQVGRASDQEQDGQDDHVPQATDQVLRLGADQVVRVVPGQEVRLELQLEAA